MRTAIISDIHGNLEALNQVLADMDHSHVEDVVCLGDNIGYGPEPEEVVKRIRTRGIPSVMGNHELALVEPRYLDQMNPTARTSIVMTRQLLSAEAMDYIRVLKPSVIFHDALCVHGCPPNFTTLYLFQVSEPQLQQLFQTMEQRVCFVGHTHDLQIVGFDGKEVTQASLNKGLVQLQEGHQYIINAGSVGQPRDGTNHAKYLIWDTASETIDVRFISYDIAKTADKILALGFPEFNARRLW